MKIVQLITGTSSFGGAEAHVRDLATGLRARGHDCTVLIGPPEGLLAEQLRTNGVPVVLIPSLRKPIHPLRDISSLVQVVRALQRLRPDVVATHTSKAGMIGRVASKIVGLPSFFTPHGLSFINREDGSLIKFRLALEYFAARCGGRIIPVCDAERRLAIDHLDIAEQDISTIHNGLPDTALPDTPATTGGRSEPPVITMIARFDVQKDHATLFQALSTMLPLAWELRLAGFGPLLASARLMAERCGIDSRVQFLQQHSNTPGLLAESDIFVLISNWEAFPISILEAMRAGLPVVATETGGVSEAIHPHVNGFLVPRGDAASIASSLSKLLASTELRRSMGAASRHRFTDNFEWSSMLDKTESLYAAACKQHPNRIADVART